MSKLKTRYSRPTIKTGSELRLQVMLEGATKVELEPLSTTATFQDWTKINKSLWRMSPSQRLGHILDNLYFDFPNQGAHIAAARRQFSEFQEAWHNAETMLILSTFPQIKERVAAELSTKKDWPSVVFAWRTRRTMYVLRVNWRYTKIGASSANFQCSHWKLPVGKESERAEMLAMTIPVGALMLD